MDKWEDTVLLLVTQLDFKREAEKIANDLQQITEGHFKQEDIEAIYDDANRAMLERQAKITWDIAFKAGEDKGKQEGFDEVVKWIENHGGSLDGFRKEWQAFLKRSNEMRFTEEELKDLRHNASDDTIG